MGPVSACTLDFSLTHNTTAPVSSHTPQLGHSFLRTPHTGTPEAHQLSGCRGFWTGIRR
jgi:hypothetical protein